MQEGEFELELKETKIGSKRIYDGKIIKLDVDTVTLPNGESATRELVRHPGGVGVVALDGDGSIYLVRQYRIPYDDILLEIPAGKLDKGEDTAVAARRELAEETGLRCGKLEFLGNFYPSVGFLDENLRMYLATELSQGETHPDDDEFVNTVKMPFDDAVKLIMDGEIKDGKTVAAILKVKVLKNL